MIYRKFLSKLAVVALIPMIAIAGLENKATAQVALVPSSTVDGVINKNSKLLPYGNGSRYGNEYSISVDAGDSADISADTEEDSKLNIVLKLISPTGTEETINATSKGEQHYYKFRTGGSWTIRIIAYDNDRLGRYHLGFVLYDAEGKIKRPIQPSQPLPAADQVMKELNLSSVPCGSPNLAVIKIGTDQRCTSTTVYPKGVYIYNAATKTLIEEQPVDPNLALIKSWGLTILPSCSGQVAAITIDSKQYCTVPDLGLSAGKYTYDRAADRLLSASSSEPDTVNPPPATNPEPSVDPSVF